MTICKIGICLSISHLFTLLLRNKTPKFLQSLTPIRSALFWLRSTAKCLLKDIACRHQPISRTFIPKVLKTIHPSLQGTPHDPFYEPNKHDQTMGQVWPWQSLTCNRNVLCFELRMQTQVPYTCLYLSRNGRRKLVHTMIWSSASNGDIYTWVVYCSFLNKVYYHI